MSEQFTSLQESQTWNSNSQSSIVKHEVISSNQTTQICNNKTDRFSYIINIISLRNETKILELRGFSPSSQPFKVVNKDSNTFAIKSRFKTVVVTSVN